MPASFRMPQRRRRSRAGAAAAGAATGALLLVLAGCTGEAPPTRPAAEPTAEPTPLADYDTTDLTLDRAAFCDRVDESSIAAALGSGSTDAPIRQDSWRPGSRLPQSSDIGNEFGCSWVAGPVAARAWVFGPPITARRAADLAGERVAKQCERLETAPALGEPSMAEHCGSGTGVTGIHGLVGDAWVGCEISGPPGSVGADTARVGEWCVAVLDALRRA